MEALMKFHAQYQIELNNVRAEYKNISLNVAAALMKETDTSKLIDALEVIAKRRTIKVLA